MKPPFDDNIKEIATSMGISVFQRFTLNEASLFLRCPQADIEDIINQGNIEYLQVGNQKPEFFGYQLIQYLMSSIHGEITPPNPIPTSNDSSERIIRSQEVKEMTSLSRTTIWRLERKGKFPARVALSEKNVGWRLSDVEEWIRNRS